MYSSSFQCANSTCFARAIRILLYRLCWRLGRNGMTCVRSPPCATATLCSLPGQRVSLSSSCPSVSCHHWSQREELPVARFVQLALNSGGRTRASELLARRKAAIRSESAVSIGTTCKAKSAIWHKDPSNDPNLPANQYHHQYPCLSYWTLKECQQSNSKLDNSNHLHQHC